MRFTAAKDLAISIIGGVIVAALTPAVLAGISQAMTGNQLQWLEGLETIHWIIIGIMAAASIATVAIIYRKYQLEHRGVAAVLIRPYDQRPVKIMDYEYVLLSVKRLPLQLFALIHK